MTRPEKNKQYSDEEMQEAILEGKVLLANQDQPILKPIAKHHHIPYTTFLHRLAKADEYGNVPNGNQDRQKLTPAQENQLVQWLLDEINLGRETTKAELKNMATRIGKQDSPDFTVGEKWYTLFMNRHKIFEYSEEGYLDIIRVHASTYNVLKKWTETYHKVVVEGKVKPCNVYNMDETNVRIEQTGRQKTFKIKGKELRKTAKLDGPSYVTVVETISLAGEKLKPKVIFQGKNVLLSWFDVDNIPDFNFDVQENGWINKELACDWLENVFIPESGAGVGKDLVVLILDGHSTHKTPEFKKICQENNIKLLILPPHTSHLTQPLDQCPFGTIKNHYRAEVARKIRDYEIKKMNKAEFLKIYNESRESSLTVKLIKKAWEQVGLLGNNYDVLLNHPDVIDKPRQSERNPFEELDVNQIGKQVKIKLASPVKDKDWNELWESITDLGARCSVQFYRFKNYVNGLRAENQMLRETLELREKEIAMLKAEKPKIPATRVKIPIVNDKKMSLGQKEIELEFEKKFEKETKTLEKRKNFIEKLKETPLTNNKKMKLPHHRYTY